MPKRGMCTKVRAGGRDVTGWRAELRLRTFGGPGRRAWSPWALSGPPVLQALPFAE